MDHVSFDEEQTSAPRSTVTHKVSAITNIVISLGLAKAQKDAEYILLGSALVMFVVATAILIHVEFRYTPPAVNPNSPQFQKEYQTPHPVRS